ncbi:hypothetical protein [Luteolibacter marinus]|uniref:hypothetical protein n=1 Tax=Luteolibacter marinus TaxID=2776705 RepID=UPI001D006387|nr:hypothetical protein [Luteolibacter marinus]
MFECWWQNDGFEAWHLRGDLRGASRRWQHRLSDELWLWINVSGDGVVWGKEHRIFLRPELSGYFGGVEGEDWKWTRFPGHHEAEILVIPRDFMIRNFAAVAAAKNTPFARWMRGESGVAFVGTTGQELKHIGDLLARGWKSRHLPVRMQSSLERWTRQLLGVPSSPPRIKSGKLPAIPGSRSTSSGSVRSAGR